MKKFVIGVVAVVVLLAVLGSISGGKAKSDGWQEVSKTSNNLTDAHFVTVDAAHMRSRSTFDAAAHKLCPTAKSGWPICQVYVYAPGDPTPPDNLEMKGIVMPVDYRRVLATYSTGQDGSPATWGNWDCQRAGEEGAPASALCGDLKNKFDSVASLAIRASRAVGCGWPRYDADADGARRYIQEIRNPEQRAMLKEAFDLLYGTGSSRPDNPSDCTRLRPKIEADAVAARRLVGVPPMPTPSRSR